MDENSYELAAPFTSEEEREAHLKLLRSLDPRLTSTTPIGLTNPQYRIKRTTRRDQT